MTAVIVGTRTGRPTGWPVGGPPRSEIAAEGASAGARAAAAAQGPGGVLCAGHRAAFAVPAATRDTWSVAPAGPQDRVALDALFAACSEDTVRLRFFGRLRAFPGEYLDSALAGRPDLHDAVVVRRRGDRAHLAGLASLVAPPPDDPAAPEIAVLVADAWQRQGAGTAMITTLLARARDRGVLRVRASVLPGRAHLLASLARRLEPETGLTSYTRDGMSSVYKLR